ncbi:MAG: tetratricopeptide repeat protein [Caldilineaceae bacterium]
MSEPTPPSQPGQTVYGPQTNITGGVTQHGGLLNTGVIYGNVVIPPPQPTRAISPTPPPDFVGRAQQLADLTNLLTAGHIAAITALHGMGGIGKTALAQTLAVRLAPHFGGGIFWASLVDYNGSAESILRTWGALCGADLSQEPNPAVLADRVRGLFAMRRDTHGPLLVVIDDIRTEWLAAAQVLKRTLPAGTPLLLTLRAVDLAEALDATVIPIDVLPATDAEALLTVRVKSPDILTPKATVNTLLAQLGYLPLAIRLAAGHINKFNRKPGFDLGRFVEEIAHRAVGLLDTAGGSGLAATFALSYTALTVDQQRIFRHCSVYSPALLTVEHIAGLLHMAPDVVETALDELVAVALLDWDQTQPCRYQCHPLLRQYAYDRLCIEEDDVQTKHRVAAVYLHQKLTSTGGTSVEALEEVDQWERGAEIPMFIERATTLVGNLDRFGYWSEIEKRLSRAAIAGKTVALPLLLQAHLLNARCIIAFKQGHWEQAQQLGEQSLHVFASIADERGLAQVYGNLGLVYAKQGAWSRALECHQKDIDINKRLGNLNNLAQAYSNLGSAYYRQGQWTQAIDCYKQSIHLKEAQGDLYGLALAYNNLGNVYERTGDWTAAIDLYTKTVTLCRPMGYDHALAQAWGNVGNIHFHKGRLSEAMSLYEEAYQLFEKLGDQQGCAQIYNNFGNIYCQTGEWAKSLDFYQKDVAISRQLGDKPALALTYGNLGVVYARLGDWLQAADYYEQSITIMQELGDITGLAKAYHNLGNLYRRQGAFDKAMGQYTLSLQIKKELGDQPGHAMTMLGIGLLHIAQGKATEAQPMLAHAYLRFVQMASPEKDNAAQALVQACGSVDAANAYLQHFLTNEPAYDG